MYTLTIPTGWLPISSCALTDDYCVSTGNYCILTLNYCILTLGSCRFQFERQSAAVFRAAASDTTARVSRAQARRCAWHSTPPPLSRSLEDAPLSLAHPSSLCLPHSFYHVKPRTLSLEFLCRARISCWHGSGDDESLILCSDGVWDVMSNAEVVEYLKRSQSSCSELLDHCVALGSTDNLSAIVVRLGSSAHEPAPLDRVPTGSTDYEPAALQFQA